jgi:hypothetical protein
MPKHRVSLRIPRRLIGFSDVEFLIQEDGMVLGKLNISQGSLAWYPKNKQKPFHIGWRSFDALMEVHGKRRVLRRKESK